MNQTLSMGRARHRPVVALAVFLGALLILGQPLTLPGRTVVVKAQSLPTLEVAAASDLRFALEEISALFEEQHRARVRISFGSSGQLATQIEQG
ncbi:MAG: substrate-binding domain-containing protein, partial [Armatimonadota bacterium]